MPHRLGLVRSTFQKLKCSSYSQCSECMYQTPCRLRTVRQS